MFWKYAANLQENTHDEVRLQSNFIEIALRHGCSPLNLLHIFRIAFSKNTSGRLLLCKLHFLCMTVLMSVLISVLWVSYLAPDSALHSAPYSAPDSKIWKISILVPFWATIDHKINFTQNILHSSFISKKDLCSSSQMLLELSTFYPIFTSFHSGWGVLYFK